MRTREIQMEFDNFDDVEELRGYFVHETAGWGASGWMFEQDVADDIMSDWQHDMPKRTFVRVGNAFVLTEVGPDGCPVIGVWHGRTDHFGGQKFYFLADFPFQQTFRVTTDPPALVRPRPLPSDEQFATFGKAVAAIFASSERWDGDVTQDVGSVAEVTLGVHIGDSMDEATWLMWQPFVTDRGREMWEFEEEE